MKDKKKDKTEVTTTYDKISESGKARISNILGYFLAESAKEAVYQYKH